MVSDSEHSVTQWVNVGSLADESLRVVAMPKLEGHSNEEIARSLDCGLRTIERKLELIRKRWIAEGTP